MASVETLALIRSSSKTRDSSGCPLFLAGQSADSVAVLLRNREIGNCPRRSSLRPVSQHRVAVWTPLSRFSWLVRLALWIR